MDYEGNLTTEWIANKFKGESQFQIVNSLIQLAHDKVKLGQGDEFTAGPKNIALDVIVDVADGVLQRQVQIEVDPEPVESNSLTV